MVRFHPGRLRPDAPTGRATRFKPEWLRVQFLLWVLRRWELERKTSTIQGCSSNGRTLVLHAGNRGSIPRRSTIWLGRQLEDHLGLEPGMLWVRIPLELLEQFKPSRSSGVLACLSRRRSSVRIRSGALVPDGVVRKRKSGEAQTFVIVCGFDSHPRHLQLKIHYGPFV